MSPIFYVLLWILMCAGITFWLLRHDQITLPAWPLAVAVGAVVRFIPALLLPRGAAYEIHVFQQAARAFRAGENVYTSTIAHPYPPLQLYWMAAATWLNDTAGLNFVFWLKSINILFDTAIIVLIYLAIAQQLPAAKARWASWVYAFNPITILVCAYQGQFDAVPLFFLLTAWLCFQNKMRRSWLLSLSAVALGIAIWSKIWPVIFLPIIWLRLAGWRARGHYTLLTGLMPLVLLLLYEYLFPGSALTIVRRALGAGAISGWWGYSAVVNVVLQFTGQGQALFQFISQWGKYAGPVAGLLVIITTRRQPALYALLLAILTMFAVVPNLGLQGLSWVIPIALIWGAHNALGWYILGAFLHMVVSYWGIHLSQELYQLLPALWANSIIQLSSLLVWIPILIWCIQVVVQRSLFPSLFSAGWADSNGSIQPVHHVKP
jgi:hypothetical protein